MSQKTGPKRQDPGGRGKRAPGESLESARRRKERALADRHELKVAQMRGELADRVVLGRVLYEQFRLARDVIATAPSRDVASVAAALGLEPRLVLPALEAFVRRILLQVADPAAAERAFLDATAPREEVPPAA